MDKELAKKVAIDSAKAAGKLILENLNKVKSCSFKAKSDIVTEIDIQAEKIIMDIIKTNFPAHSIHSEETGFIDNKSPYLWVIDPIDGTMNYYHRMSPFRVAICLVENNLPIITAIYNPVKDNLYFAEKGKGAFLNNKRINVNSNFELKKSVVMTHISSKKEARARTITALGNIFNKTLHMRILGSGIAAMTYIAEGKFDVFFNVATHPWDILPGALLVEEAGGIVTDIQGKKIDLKSTSILVSNGTVHSDILKLLEDI